MAPIIICVNQRLTDQQPSCAARGSCDIADALERAAAGLPIPIVRIHCFGKCGQGPVAKIGADFCYGIKLEDVPELVAKARCL